jgi:hypothetical protein
LGSTPGSGSARIAYQTTSARYTIGIFRINIMKTSSQAPLDIHRVYDRSREPVGKDSRFGEDISGDAGTVARKTEDKGQRSFTRKRPTERIV